MRHLNACLRLEYPQVRFQTLLPGFVQTELTKTYAPAWYVLRPEEFARSAVRTLGLMEEVRGHWAHQLFFDVFCWLLPFLPRGVKRTMLRNFMLASKRDNEVYMGYSNSFANINGA